MKKITIGLNLQEVDKARKYVLDIKKKLPKIINEFLEDVALWIIERANFYVANSDIGENVKIDIINGWIYEFTPLGIKVINSSQQAVFVEFGVGIIGQEEPHPNANNEGYEYNKPSPYKYAGKFHDEFTWRFLVKDKEDIDLPKNTYETWKKKSGDLKIITKGAKGVWFLYNAVVDAQLELSQGNGGKIGEMWRKAERNWIVV